MTSGNDVNLVSNISQAMRADPKKTGLLSVLGLVLAVVIGRMALSGGKSGPSAANASPAWRSGSQSQSARNGNAAVTSSRNASAIASALQKWSDAPVPPISRNFFTVRIDYFPVDGSRTAQAGVGDDGFWSKLEKSMALQADQKDKLENLKANFKAQAEQLKITSTMLGPQPRAIVNGEMVAEGSVVANFRVLKIESRRITVEREGIKLEIQTK